MCRNPPPNLQVSPHPGRGNLEWKGDIVKVDTGQLLPRAQDEAEEDEVDQVVAGFDRPDFEAVPGK